MQKLTVDTVRMVQCGSSLKTQGGTIRGVIDRMKGIHNDLPIGTLDAQRTVVRQMILAETDLLEQAVKAENLGKALEFFATQYAATEQENRDGVTLESAFKHLIHDAFIATLSALGLDEAYYRRQMGYTAFQGEKVQEKLMDEYLSEACAQLMKQDKYSQAAWDKADADERKQMLIDFVLDINRIMGTDVNQSVLFKKLDSSTRGQYSSKSNQIIINNRFLSDTSPDSYRVFQTVIHEMRHCYQHQASEHPEQFMVSQQTLEQWRYNFNHYQSGDYASYVQQPIEWDSKNFARQYGDTKGYHPDYPGSWGYTLP